ncbi:GNAT family N-acetyltransferase [Desulfospira joergensenii]|uniref:GNAT family N-acetyltransferase n=1 Tax=Desulfospira joergensenii TaxID=53329 RepID=UPI0003B7599C|nr:GNAT family N-acetyltransferase [Desulfospira joergensenii]
MESNKLKLRPLRPEDELSFKNAVAAFRNKMPAFEFAFDFDESIPFLEYIKKLEGWPLGKGLPDKFVPSTFLVGVVDRQIVGRLSIRHYLNDFLERIGGHIGYGVIPACRRQGYAMEMFRQALPICSDLGIQRVLITCDMDNLGSRKVIEKCGGIFENLTEDPELKVQKRRYWIDIQ